MLPVLAALALAAAPAQAAPPREIAIGPLDHLGEVLRLSFFSDRALLHVAGVAATYALSEGGADAGVHDYFRLHPGWSNFGLAAVTLGALAPGLVAIPLFTLGELRDAPELLAASFAVLQATVLTLAWATALKAVTGRPYPTNYSAETSYAQSTTWRFGFLRGGVFWGWPSGHTANAMAWASALATFWRDRPWIVALCYAWVVYTALSVLSFHDGQMHWLSDAVAGGAMAWAIGSSAGEAFRDGRGGEPAPAPRALVPGDGRGDSGLSLVWGF